MLVATKGEDFSPETPVFDAAARAEIFFLLGNEMGL